ncbi:MAG: 50S ribosomal protein L10 [Spirochaetaceae bacterium]|nr:50S ribosomal protein L10 [Spirochaetaceae bacterium]
MSDYQVTLQDHKLAAVNEMKSELENVKDIIFTDYRGLTVERITELRAKLRAQEAVFKVVKNRYTKIALSQLKRPDVGDQLVGPTALALVSTEAGPVAKELVDFAKDGVLVIKGGIIDGNIFNADQVVAFSKLPTKPELIAKLMATMNAPLQNMVYILNAVPQKLVRTLQAVADKKGE